jgi:hypothetical protein
MKKESLKNEYKMSKDPVKCLELSANTAESVKPPELLRTFTPL